MNYPESTYEILAFKALKREVTDAWMEWAIEMIENGYETEHLLVLAGISKPYNQFYLDELTAKVFQELALDWSSQQEVLSNYSAYLAGEALDGKRSYREVLRTLKDICIELNYEETLMDFYLLFFALDDLVSLEKQVYWPNATRENINEIIADYFRSWRDEQYGRENSNR